MKWKITLFILVICVQMAIADRDSTKIRYSLGVTPSAVVNVLPAFQLSHELRLSHFFALGLETGYGFAHTNVNDQNVKGLRLRPQLKLKLHEEKDFNVDIFVFYNYRYFRSNRSVDQVKGNGAYTEEVQGNRTSTFNGYGYGVDFGFSNVDNFLKKVNLGFGLGYGSIINKYSDPILELTDFFEFNNDGETTMPILILHVSFILI
jgi:hypothetical protein